MDPKEVVRVEVGDRVRLTGSDCPEAMYYTVVEVGLPEPFGGFGGPRVALMTAFGNKVTCAEASLTTDPPLDPLPHLREPWKAAQSVAEGHLDRGSLRNGRAARRTAGLKKIMDKAEADAAWQWARR